MDVWVPGPSGNQILRQPGAEYRISHNLRDDIEAQLRALARQASTYRKKKSS